MARYFLAFSEKEYHLSFQGILKKFNFSFLPLWFWLVQVRDKLKRLCRAAESNHKKLSKILLQMCVRKNWRECTVCLRKNILR